MIYFKGKPKSFGALQLPQVENTMSNTFALKDGLEGKILLVGDSASRDF
jgi:hypothetical protein